MGQFRLGKDEYAGHNHGSPPERILYSFGVHPTCFFEEAKEMLRILEAQHFCDLLRVQVRIENRFLGHLRDLGLDTLLCAFACGRLD